MSLTSKLAASAKRRAINLRQQMRSFRLGASLIVAIVASSLLLLIGGLEILRSRDAAIEDARLKASNLSRSLSQQAARSIESVDLVLSNFVERVESDTDLSKVAVFLKHQSAKLPQVRNLLLSDKTGSITAQALDQKPLNVAARSYFEWHQGHSDRSMHVDPVVASKGYNEPIIPLTRRVNAPDGSFAGVVIGALYVKNIHEFYNELNVGQHGAIGLWNENDRSDLRQPSITRPKKDFRNDLLFDNARGNRSGLYVGPSPVDGIKQIVSYDRLDRYPYLIVTVGLSIDEALAPWRGEAIIQGSILLIASLSLIGISIAFDLRARQANASAKALALSNARYRLVADNTTDMITHMDLDGRRRFVSPACQDLLGYSPHELVGSSPHQMIHPDDAFKLALIFADFAAGRIDRYVNINRLHHKDGRWIWIEASLRLLRDTKGEASSVVGVMRDITERRRAQAAAKESETTFRLLAENTSELIILAKSDGRNRYISPASQRLVGYTSDALAEEMKQQRWVHPDDREMLAQASFGDSGMASIVCRVKHKNGAWIWVEAVIRRFTDKDDDEPSIIATFRDVTERQAQAAALTKAKAEAEQANQAKAEFLAAMSHEIRTPLNAVLGYADLLLSDSEIGDQRRVSLERIQNAGSALRTVVDDILDFSKIEAGKIEFAPHPFRPCTLIDNALSIVRGSAQAKSLDIIVDIDANVPDLVVGDHDRLRQVLLNLLNNAIKFTPSGSVTVSVRLPEGSQTAATLRFAVEDTGIGIASDKLGRLFQRFSQIDGSITRDFGGTGLGLAICRRLINAMGGKVGVISDTESGSTFWFDVTLPVANSSAVTTQAENESLLRQSSSVLLVEDQEVNRDLACAVLHAAGHTVDTVCNGSEAVAAVKNKCYDVVLMDVQMPVMGGVEATRRIRQSDHPSRLVPIIAMTANVLPAQVAEHLAAGMSGHVGKPFRRQELLAAVDKHSRGIHNSSDDADELDTKQHFQVNTFDRLVPLIGLDKLNTLLSKTLMDVAEIMLLEDREVCAARAHAILSGAGMLGLATLSSSLRDLEAACLSQGPTTAALNATAAALKRARNAVAKTEGARDPSVAA